jgi:hypothetical protein
MAGCTPCEESFNGGLPLLLSLVKSGGNLLVYAQNTGKNIVFVRLIVVCRIYTGGSTFTFHREDGGASPFVVGGARIEPGLSQLKVSTWAPSSGSARAIAHYYEVPCRVQSCEVEI